VLPHPRSNHSTVNHDSRGSTLSTLSGTHSVLNSNAAAFHSLSSLYAGSVSNISTDNNNNHVSNSISSNNGSAVGAARRHFTLETLPQNLQQRQQQHHQQFGSPLNSPSFVVEAALPVRLDTPAQARLAHLEYPSHAASLSPESYLPELQPPQQPEASPSSTGDGLKALQDATTGLLVRHLALENLGGGGGGGLEKQTSAPATAAAAGGGGTAYETARAEALMKAAPFISAAVFDTGVDDRINPFLLDKMIRKGRRQHAAAAAAERTKTKTTCTPAAATETAAAKSASPGKAAVTGAETRYHEPPALQAAYDAINVPASPSTDAVHDGAWPGARAVEPADGNTLAEILAEYASDAQGEESAPRTSRVVASQRGNKPRGITTTTATQGVSGGGRGGALALWNTKATPHMSSPDYTRLASAASANDAAFIRQLVNYYAARTRATTTAAELQRTRGTGTVLPYGATTRVPLTSSALATVKNGTATVDTNTSRAGAVPVGVNAAHRFGDDVSGSRFSLLDAVLSVSREYVAAQAAENGLSGKGTAALSERRRQLLHQLIALDQTRIPESLWVTCAPPLSRLSALTSAAGSRIPTQTALESSAAAHAGGSENTADSVKNPAAVTARSEDERRSTRNEGRDSVDAASMVATLCKDSVPNNDNRPRPRSGGGNADNLVPANTIFPAARPMDRSQVYLLADALDRMLHDPSHPQWVELMSNPEVAYYVFAKEDENDEELKEQTTPTGTISQDRCNNNNNNDGGDAARGHAEMFADAYAAVWGPPGEQRLTVYTDAAQQVLNILDTGLSELVRQVTCHCTERGALLDLLRQSVVDIAAAQVHVLAKVKQQARRDAAAALALRAENSELREQLAALQRKLADVKAAHTQLQARLEPIQRKSDRLDELMARVASKARRFETHRHDEHTALLQLLEESMQQTSSAAVDALYSEVNDMHVRHAGEDDRDNNTHGVAALPGVTNSVPLLLAAEMPSVAAARTRAAEQRHIMERMYTESHQLLRVLQDIVEATNAVCSPLYKKMVLTDVSPVAKVASSKWTAIARAVGAFEREKQHRQRVYDVFTEYCTVFRHEQAATAAAQQANADGSSAGGTQRSSLMPGGDSNVSAGVTVQSYGESFLVDHPSPNGGGGDGSGDEGEAANCDAEVRKKVRALQCRVPPPHDQTAASNPFSTIITRADLEAMSASDCTVEEVNALFRKDFDIRAYLRGSWEDYVHDRRLQEGATGDGDAYTLQLPDLLQMLCDLHATLAEVTMRMRAMADSGVLQALLRPPLEPPAHPGVPCPLCSRRDNCEMDRQRRREAMSRIARELQGRMDAVKAKSRAAQLERDEAKREVRRLKMELQQVSEGNPPATHAANQRKSGTSGLNARNSSASSFWRGRRDTSTPPLSAPPQESSIMSVSNRNSKGGGGNTSSQQQQQQVRRVSSETDGWALSHTSHPSPSHPQHPHRQRGTRTGEEEAKDCDGENTDSSPEEAREGRHTASFETVTSTPSEHGAPFSINNVDEADRRAGVGGGADDEEEEDEDVDGEGATTIPSQRRVTATM
jgi:hypothetical protein